MAEPIDTTNYLPEELEALQSRSPVLPADAPAADPKPISADEVPPPSNAVVDRMRQRIAAAENAEEAFKPDASTTQESDEPKTPDSPAEEEPQITDADKNAFLLHVLGGAPFTKAYDLFGGRMKAVMRVRTAAEDDMASRQAYLDDQLLAGGQETEAVRRDAARLARYRNYCMAISLDELSIPGQAPRRFAPLTGANPPETDLHLRLKELRTELSQPLFMILFRIWQQFEDVCGTLLLESQSPDFWKTGAAT